MAKVHHFQYRSDDSRWAAFYRTDDLTDEEAQRFLEMFERRWQSGYRYQIIPEVDENSRIVKRARRKWGEALEWAGMIFEPEDIPSPDKLQQMAQLGEECEEDILAMRSASPEETASDDSDVLCVPHRPPLRDIDIDYVALWKDTQELLEKVESLHASISDLGDLRCRHRVDLCEVAEVEEVCEFDNMLPAAFNQEYKPFLDAIRNAAVELDALVAEERFQNRMSEWAWEGPPSARLFVDALGGIRGQIEYLVQVMGLGRTGRDAFWTEASMEFGTSAEALKKAIAEFETVPSLRNYLQHEARKRLYSQTGPRSSAAEGTGETDLAEGQGPDAAPRPVDGVEATEDADVPKSDSGERVDVPRYLGGARYQVGDEFIQLEFAENKVLAKLVELRVAKKPDLEKVSENAISILKQVKKKKAYKSLAPHIVFPGGKGKGGYRTTIVPASPDVFK